MSGRPEWRLRHFLSRSPISAIAVPDDSNRLPRSGWVFRVIVRKACETVEKLGHGDEFQQSHLFLEFEDRRGRSDHFASGTQSRSMAVDSRHPPNHDPIRRLVEAESKLQVEVAAFR